MRVADIIRTLGSDAAVAAALGVSSPNSVTYWRKRRSIPVRYWPRIVARATDLGRPDITAEVLMAAHADDRSPVVGLDNGNTPHSASKGASQVRERGRSRRSRCTPAHMAPAE